MQAAKILAVACSRLFMDRTMNPYDPDPAGRVFLTVSCRIGQGC